MAQLTQQELESHLWKAADILRGAIDAADYKHYIFGLLFFKRLSDVWQEEFDDRMKEFKDEKLAADPEEHRFHIPKGCFWENIKKKSTNIGEALNSAFRKIEDENLRLKGVFQDVDFNNKERFPDSVLEKLIQHFDKYSLRKKDVSADMLGNAYEYLIAKFADDAGAKGGEFYTPKEVVRLIVECLQPSNNQTVYDPTCGSAGMLLEAFHYMERNKKNAKSLRLFGQEKNLNTWAISQMNLFLHDLDDAVVLRGDTIAEPKHLQEGNSKRIKQFDLVIANPPFSLKSWGYDTWKTGDPYARDTYGCPPQSYGDLAFVQHMIASLKPKGRMGVVLPHGVLFRGGKEGEIRKKILEDTGDIVEAVIGLADNLFYGAGIPACILMINKAKPPIRKGKVLFINAELDFEDAKIQNKLRMKDIEKIANTFTKYTESSRFSKIIDINEIRENDYTLSIRRYVDTAPPPETYDVKGILKGLIPVREVEADYNKQILNGLKLDKLLRKEGAAYLKFKADIRSKDQIRNIIPDASPEALKLIERWWIKYGQSLLELEASISDLEKRTKKRLAELGYE
ncbi:MAG: type I restriction-modification system subunit M [Bdellovibrionota bacterium]